MKILSFGGVKGLSKKKKGPTLGPELIDHLNFILAYWNKEGFFNNENLGYIEFEDIGGVWAAECVHGKTYRVHVQCVITGSGVCSFGNGGETAIYQALSTGTYDFDFVSVLTGVGFWSDEPMVQTNIQILSLSVKEVL